MSGTPNYLKAGDINRSMRSHKIVDYLEWPSLIQQDIFLKVWPLTTYRKVFLKIYCPWSISIQLMEKFVTHSFIHAWSRLFKGTTPAIKYILSFLGKTSHIYVCFDFGSGCVHVTLIILHWNEETHSMKKYYAFLDTIGNKLTMLIM